MRINKMFGFKRERGQVAMLTALLLPILLGMAGMAIDVGTYAGDRRHLQNSADAIALAAAQELPNASKATAIANEWAANNSINLEHMKVTVTGGSVDPKVRVEIERSHRFVFMRVLGISERGVGARATAAKLSFGGAPNIVPWSVSQDTVNASPVGTIVTIKYDSSSSVQGNLGAIRIDGTGSSVYEKAAKYGAASTVCADTTVGCVKTACASGAATCVETAPQCDGPECKTETGNMTGGTRDAVDFRMNHTSAQCDTFDEVFTYVAATGKHRITSNCSPWIGPGECPTGASTVLCSRRVIIVPVVTNFGSGSSAVTLKSFALMFLEGYVGGKCSGNSCEILGRFVNADVSLGALGGAYDANAAMLLIKLVE